MSARNQPRLQALSRGNLRFDQALTNRARARIALFPHYPTSRLRATMLGARLMLPVEVPPR
jgi:hypothetical protein